MHRPRKIGENVIFSVANWLTKGSQHVRVEPHLPRGAGAGGRSISEGRSHWVAPVRGLWYWDAASAISSSVRRMALDQPCFLSLDMLRYEFCDMVMPTHFTSYSKPPRFLSMMRPPVSSDTTRFDLSVLPVSASFHVYSNGVFCSFSSSSVSSIVGLATASLSMLPW